MSTWVISMLTLCSAAMAKADGVVRTDFVFQLDNSVFTSPEFDFHSRLGGEEKFDIPDTILEDEAPVHVRGIKANVRYKLATGLKQIHLGVETMFASTELSAQLQIREVEVDSIVEKVVGGVRVRAHVKALCRDIPIELKNGAVRAIGGIHVFVNAEGLPSLEVPWLGLDWGGGAWSIGEFRCEGASGFKEQVVAKLKSHLADSKRFESDLKSEIDRQIRDHQQKIRQWFLEERSIDSGLHGLSLVLRPRQIARLQGDRFQVLGQIEFRFSNSAISTVREIRESTPEEKLSLYSLTLPEKAAFALNQAAFEAGFYGLRKRGSELPGFENLRGSVLKSSIAWPELNRVQKSGEFFFDFNTPEQPRFSTFVDDGKGAIWVRAESKLSVLTSAPVGSQHSAFANFRTPINGSMALSIVPRSADKSAIKMIFTSDLKMKLEAAWDPRYSPQKSHIAVDTIEKEIVRALTTEGLQFEFGAMKLTKELSLRGSKLGKIGSSWLELRLVPTSSSP